MSYSSQILATTGLAAYWPLDDAPGSTTARDLGPNNLPLTVAAGHVFGNAAMSSELARALHVDNSGNTFRNVTVSTDPLAGVTAFSLVFLARYTAIAAGTVGMWGRNGQWAISLLNSGKFRSSVPGTATPPAGQATSSDSRVGPAVGDVFLLGFTWSQASGEARLYINGVLDNVHQRPGPLTFSSAALNLAQSSANAYGMDLNGAAVFTRALGAAEQRDLYKAAVGTPPVDFTSLADIDVPAASTPAAGIVNAHLGATEARITNPDGSVYRPDVYGAMALEADASFPTAANGSVQVPRLAAKLTAEFAARFSERSHSQDLWYFDGTSLVYNGVSGTFPRSQTAVAVGMAALQRFKGLSSKRSWALNVVKTLAEHAWALQDPTDGHLFGTVAGPDTYFAGPWLAYATLLVRRQLDTATLSRWIANLERAGDYIDGAAAGQNAYYVNGNIELDATVFMYELYLLTGKQKWLDAFNAHWAKTLYPTDTYQTSTGAGNAGTAGYGLRDGSGGVIANDAALLAMSDTTGKGYLGESANPGAVGLDWDYLQVQLNLAFRLFRISNDPRALKLVNVFVNKASERLQYSTPPTSNAPTTATTGGSLAAATYYLKVTALTTAGETLTSAEQSIATTGAASTITQTWAAVTNASGYRVYIGTSAGGEDRYFEVGAVLTLTITTLTGATLKAPPTVPTAYTWNYDATGGSRHSLVTAWYSPAAAYLVWSGRRPDLNHPVHDHWVSKVKSDWRNSAESNQENYWQFFDQVFTGWMEASPSWPGVPA